VPKIKIKKGNFRNFFEKRQVFGNFFQKYQGFGNFFTITWQVSRGSAMKSWIIMVTENTNSNQLVLSV